MEDFSKQAVVHRHDFQVIEFDAGWVRLCINCGIEYNISLGGTMTTTELKAVLTFLFSVTQLVDDVATKGLSVSELNDVLDVIKNAPVAYADLALAGKEYLTLDAAAQADLQAFISQALNVNPDAIENVVKTLLNLGVELSAALQLFVK